MPSIVMAADAASVILNGTPITDFVAGDHITLAFPNGLTNHIPAGNGGVNIQQRVDADVCDLTVRVQKYSASDVFLNSATNSATPVVFKGSVRADYVREGAAAAEAYILENGTIASRPQNTYNNQDGNDAMEYVLHFRRAQRSL